MKKLNDFLILSAFFSGVLTASPAYASEKMNIETQDLVIKKMERVLSTLEKNSPSWMVSQQRLADLLAERARTRFMLEIEANCNTSCKGSMTDREQAIGIYETLLKDLKLNEHGPVLFQLAHLYEMAGKTDKAISLYEDIIKDQKKKSIKGDIVTRSRIGLGDLLFQKGEFNKAKEHYQIALKSKSLQNRYLTQYNLAWSQYNTDQLNRAISTMESLLKDPSQITRETEGGKTYDAPFHSDILRDLATFYTKKSVTEKEISTFENLTPVEKRKEMMLHFAKETDRIGQKKAAQEIMSRYLANNALSKDERLEASIQLAQIYYDRGQSKQSVLEFTKATKDFDGCSKDKCESLQKSMRTFVTELHRSKKLKPDSDLMNAYLAYNSAFPLDSEMTHRAAFLALELNNFDGAVKLYRSISTNKKASDKERNEALLNEISAAEQSKSIKLQREAYQHFLKTSDDEVKGFEVRYQLAYLNYQEKKFSNSAKDFETLAKDEKGNLALRKKAADLSLDSLVQSKNESRLESLAWEYSEIFKKDRAEFETIARKSLMNQVATVANNQKSSQSDLKKSLRALDDSKIKSASAAEKMLFYKNQSVLAQKVGDDKTFIVSSNAQLALPGLSEAQREDVLEQMTGYYERKLDFRNAYSTALRMNQPKISQAEKEFRLGTLADLAGMNSSKHYKASLKAGLSGQRSFLVRSRLVMTAKNSISELKEQAPELKKRPALLNEAVLVVYAKTGNAKALKSVLEMPELRRQSAPNFIAKQDFYAKVQREKVIIGAHKLNTKNDRTVQRTLTERINLLQKADGLLAESLKLKDVTAQMMALNIVAYENLRLVSDLAALPLPKGLSPAEQNQYLGLLKNQSRPYFVKAQTAQQQQQAIWAKSPALAQTLKDFQSAGPELRNLLAKELSLLAELPGNGPMKSAVENALREKSFTMNDLTAARTNVSEDPSNARNIERLKAIETKIGHPLMPSYLEARLTHLQRGNSL